MPGGLFGGIGSVPGALQLVAPYTLQELITSQSGLALYYQCEEPTGSTVAADYTAAREGSYTGTCTLQTPGPSESAVEISSGGYLNSGTLAYNLAPAGGADIMFWYRCESYPATESLLFGLVESSTVWSNVVTLDETGTIRLRGSSTKPLNFISMTNFPLGRWNFITFQASNTIAGGLQCNVSRNPPPTQVLTVHGDSSLSTPITFTNPGNVYVGGGPLSPFPGCPGTYDEVAIFQFYADGAIPPAYYSNLTFGILGTMYEAGAANIALTQARVTALNVTMMTTTNPKARVTNFSLEVARRADRYARVSQSVVEVLRSTPILVGTTAAQTLTFTQTVVGTFEASPPKVISQTLAFTQSVTLVTGHWIARSVSQTLTFTETTVGHNAGHAASNTLAFTETVTQHFSVRNIKVLQTLDFTESTGRAGSTLSQGVFQLLTFTSSTPVHNSKAVLQALNFVQTVVATRAKSLKQTLTFTQTVSIHVGGSTDVSQQLAFTQTLHIVRPVIKVLQSLVYNQTPNIGLIVEQTCDRGTLGDTDLGDFVLGVECGPGGPNGFAQQTIAFTDTLALRKIYHRTINDRIIFTQANVTPTGFVRSRGIVQTLTFFDKDFPRQIAIGTGLPYIYTQPTLIETVVRGYPSGPSREHPRLTMTIASPKGVITLPAPVFDDSEKTNNKIQIQKVMSTKTYTYVKRVDRLTLTYEFELDRKKSLELQAYYAFNQSDYLILTNWKGQIYVGKFGNNPIELSTTGRNNKCDFEFVTVSLEFQGVRIHG